ncbi:hypothetical protein Pfo_021621 [Paulownia fortunei]|nr:hypothetical protein Pfo_021621 [Paulownia fortunei]
MIEREREREREISSEIKREKWEKCGGSFKEGNVLKSRGDFYNYSFNYHIVLLLNYVLQHVDVIKDAVPRDPGPWVGSSGKKWDDGVFPAIKQFQVHVCKSINIIHALQFEYVRSDGKCVWMPKHGGNGGDIINIDYKNEFLIGVADFYGSIEGNIRLEIVRLMTFYSNKGKYGPFGIENDTYFTLISSGGKVVGFRENCGACVLEFYGCAS